MSGLELGRFLTNVVGSTPHPTLAATTAITDSIGTIATSCSEATGWVRHSVILTWSDRVQSKNFGS